MKKMLLIGSIIAVSILILPSSITIGLDTTRSKNKVFINNLKIKNIPPLIFDIIIGKISNLSLSGGYTPCYNFHVDKCLIFSTFIPFFRIRTDCNGRIVIPSFSGFITDSSIFGITYTLYIPLSNNIHS